MRSHQEYAEWAGAYVVGALSASERQEFDRHLTDCALCRDAVGELAALPGLLARLDPEEALRLDASTAELPDGFEQRLLAAADREATTVRSAHRRRLAVRIGVGVAAAAAVAAVAAGVVVPLQRSEAPSELTPVPAAIELHPVGGAGGALSAEARLVPAGWGTRIEMTCRYADQRYVHERPFALYLTDQRGRRTLLARWHAGPGETARTSGSTDVGVDDIARLQVQDARTGEVLLAWRG